MQNVRPIRDLNRDCRYIVKWQLETPWEEMHFYHVDLNW